MVRGFGQRSPRTFCGLRVTLRALSCRYPATSKLQQAPASGFHAERTEAPESAEG
jgi:hypothetical protein